MDSEDLRLISFYKSEELDEENRDLNEKSDSERNDSSSLCKRFARWLDAIDR